VGDSVFIACCFTFPFFGNFTFAASPGLVALAVAAVTVADTPMPVMALFGGRLLIVTVFSSSCV
jgi:hypothetical protein